MSQRTRRRAINAHRRFIARRVVYTWRQLPTVVCCSPEVLARPVSVDMMQRLDAAQAFYTAKLCDPTSFDL